MLLGRYKDALTDFNRVVALDPLCAGALASRGEIYRQLGQYESAIRDFDAAIRLGPDRDWVFAERGEAHRAIGEYEKALEDLNRAVQLNPEDSWNVVLRGRILKLPGSEADADADFREATNSAEDEYALACVLAIQGDVEASLKQLAIALEKGQRTKHWVRQDPDLIALRGDPRFIALTTPRARSRRRNVIS
jgi:tetratricopeptide (TPR) repeat protein